MRRTSSPSCGIFFNSLPAEFGEMVVKHEPDISSPPIANFRRFVDVGRWDTTFAAATQAVPPLLFGVRLWAAVCLALYVAFWLQLDTAYWAGTTAALVCQPSQRPNPFLSHIFHFLGRLTSRPGAGSLFESIARIGCCASPQPTILQKATHPNPGRPKGRRVLLVCGRPRDCGQACT
jgi:Fusaric acid resistance protein family